MIDYKKENYTKSGESYDVIVDVAAHRSIFSYSRALRRDGAFAFVGASVSTVLQTAFIGPLISKSRKKNMGIVVVYPTAKELDTLRELLESGKITPVIDRQYPLNEVADALRYIEAGNAKRKVVVSIQQEKGG